MALDQRNSTQIALNVTRTRVTVLVFNLTIIAFMLSMMAQSGITNSFAAKAHLLSSVALFFGFCLTLLGLLLLLQSQNFDVEGLSRPFPFTLGSITAYLAVSQTVTAFVHEYLLKVASELGATPPAIAQGAESLARLDPFGYTALAILYVMGGAIWVLITYAAPLGAVLNSPARGGRGWVFAGYFLALQVPIHWVYADAWRVQYVPADQPVNMLSLFALQFFQPLLWLR